VIKQVEIVLHDTLVFAIDIFGGHAFFEIKRIASPLLVKSLPLSLFVDQETPIEHLLLMLTLNQEAMSLPSELESNSDLLDLSHCQSHLIRMCGGKANTFNYLFLYR
jgi:hypothetical protein